MTNIYKLHNFIHDKKINYYMLYCNPHDYAEIFYKNKLKYIKKNVNGLNLNNKIWDELCKSNDDRVLQLVSKNFSKLDNDSLSILCSNTSASAIKIISQNIKKINIYCLITICSNSSDAAVKFILENIDFLKYKCIDGLCLNNNDHIVDLILHDDLIRHECILYGKSWYALCSNNNDRIVDFILKHIDDKKQRFNFTLSYLCENSNIKILDYIEKHINELTYNCLIKLCKNLKSICKLTKHKTDCIEKIVNIIKKFFDTDMIDRNIWCILCEIDNDYVIDVLLYESNYIEKILLDNFGTRYHWYHLCLNTNDRILTLLLQYLNKIIFNTTCWKYLCMNTNSKALYIIQISINKLSVNNYNNILAELCKNKNPKAIEIIMNNISCFNNYRCFNNYHWNILLMNPNIITYNYDKMVDNKKELHKELYNNVLIY